MSRLFGTDGIRGEANVTLTAELAFKLAFATCKILAEQSGKRTMILAHDSRISADMIEAALISGITSCGFDVLSLGLLPTPGLAYLCSLGSYAGGIMISASHNPFAYNGLKVFAPTGRKLPDKVEDRIEALMAAYPGGVFLDRQTGGSLGRVERDPELQKSTKELYVDHLLRCFDEQRSDRLLDRDGHLDAHQPPIKPLPLKVAIDCANGASSEIAPRIFTKVIENPIFFSHTPSGVNINADCGSTHLDALSKAVCDEGCDLGFAFDGDADRVLFVDHTGQEINGDQVMAIIGAYWKDHEALVSNTIVATVMSNFGLEKFCDQEGIKLCRTQVGDRYVLETMLEGGYNLGGEQSGHIILRDYATTGDGMLTALTLLQVVRATQRTLEDLAQTMTNYPQNLTNVRVSAKAKEHILDNPKVQNMAAEVEEELLGHGRLVLRASGTEPLIRIMIEADDPAMIGKLTAKLEHCLIQTAAEYE